MKEDGLLIDETLAGNNAAFGQLVQKYQDRLFNTLVHVTGCPEEAEDVAQETFVQAFLKLNTFQRRASVYTWMYRIAFNLWISRRRRKRPEVSVEQSREMVGDEPTDDSEEPLERLEREERAHQIQLAISELSRPNILHCANFLSTLNIYCYLVANGDFFIVLMSSLDFWPNYASERL